MHTFPLGLSLNIKMAKGKVFLSPNPEKFSKISQVVLPIFISTYSVWESCYIFS